MGILAYLGMGSLPFASIGVGVWGFVLGSTGSFSLLSYEIKAAKDLERYNREASKAMQQAVHRPTKDTERQKPKLKSSLSNQQKLDKMFHTQTEKKQKAEQPLKTVTVPFSLSSCRHQRREKSNSAEHELYLIRRQSFPDIWIFATEKKLMLLNPYRLEEALLHKRLLKNHQLPVEKLDKPIVLTDRYSTNEQKSVYYLNN